MAELEIVEYQFIKLRVRHITAGRGVVSGSVLFTPNAVIFDPDPKDPLVEELEPEAFQIIAPMEFVVNAAIFYDFFPIGSTGRTVGREHPPSEIFRAPEPEAGRGRDQDKAGALQRQQTSESSYSLSRETEDTGGEAAAHSASPEADGEATDPGTEQPPDLSRLEPYYLRLTMGKPVDREVSRWGLIKTLCIYLSLSCMQVHPHDGVREADDVARVLVHRAHQADPQPVQVPPLLVPGGVRTLRPGGDSRDGHGARPGTGNRFSRRGQAEYYIRFYG